MAGLSSLGVVFVIMDAFESAKKYLEACDSMQITDAMLQEHSAEFYSSEDSARKFVEARKKNIQQATKVIKIYFLCVQTSKKDCRIITLVSRLLHLL